MKFILIIILLTVTLSLSQRKRSMLRTSVTAPCTIRLILDAGSSGTGGAMGLEHNGKMYSLGIKVLRPADLKKTEGDGEGKQLAKDFYATEIAAIVKQDESEVERILDNNLRLSNVTDKEITSVRWSDAAKVHVTKFYSSTIINAKDKIKNWIIADTNIVCSNTDEMLKRSNFKVFMGATAGIRNVINGYILKGRETQFIDSTNNLKTLLSENKDPSGKPFFAEFGFKYIAGRTEGMFGMIVGLNIAETTVIERNKLVYVEMGGASTQVAFMSEVARYNNSAHQFAKSQTGGMIKADNKQYFSQSWLGNACDRGPSSLLLNYLRDIIRDEIGVKTVGEGTNWVLAGNNLTVKMPCLNPGSKLEYVKGAHDRTDFFKTDTAGQVPTKSQIDDNYNKFLQNDTLYGIYDETYKKMTSIVIEGTGDSVACKPLVDKYLLGDNDDEYLDHIELQEIEEKLKAIQPLIYLKESLTQFHNLEDSMKNKITTVLGKADQQISQQKRSKTQKAQFEQLKKNLTGLSKEKTIVMTNAWGSISPESREEGVEPRVICAGINTGGMTLKAFRDCLPELCKDPAVLAGKDNYNYGLCTTAHNLYGILNNIATAIGKGDSMMIQRVISEWSDGPFKIPIAVFESMKEDLFQGRGSKALENENIS